MEKEESKEVVGENGSFGLEVFCTAVGHEAKNCFETSTRSELEQIESKTYKRAVNCERCDSLS
jgi:hypothetical protein